MDAVDASQRKPYSIGHVSDVTGVNASTLRSWEQQGLIEPAKSVGGRRTFTDEDIQRIVTIGRMRRVYGYSIAGVKRALSEQALETPANPQAADVPDADPRLDRIGARVRALRVEAGLSLRQTAEKTGVAASHLSMFERGVAFPSPSRLASIARLFNRSLADLLGGTSTRGQPFIRRGQGRIVGSFGPGVCVEQLTVSERLMDCEIWTISPSAESEGFYAHEGEELIHVLEGAFELSLDGDPAEILNAGDSAYFDSTRQHRWRNPGAEAAVVLWVNTDSRRLSALEQTNFTHSLKLGSLVGRGVGEQTLALSLPEGCKTYRVVDTHTAGHPTRVLIEPLDGLEGATVREKRDRFRERHDKLRSLLLHEPRGHAATFGLVPVRSEQADFGAIFVSSYKYLDMCGHGTIGYARVLSGLGRLGARTSFSLETPAGVVQVALGLHGSPENITLENVPSFVGLEALDLPEIAPGCVVSLSYGGAWYATADVASFGLAIAPDNVSLLMELGARIKDAVNRRLPARGAGIEAIDSTLFYEEKPGLRPRQLVILERNKFDRSPCGTGLSARMAELALKGRLKAGDRYEVENVLGIAFLGEVAADSSAAGRPAIIPRVTGRANLSGFSTLIVEANDPLPDGFLCR